MKRPWNLGLAGLILIGLAYGGWILLRPGPINLILITLDTTRADRIGCYGYQAAETPRLDALAKRGVLFERAYAPGPMTSPSHTSMLTGLWPPEHGVITNGLTGLGPGVETAAELLQRRGFQTVAFPAASMLNAKFGLNQGFQEYHDDLSDSTPGADPLHRSRDGRFVVDDVIAWLQGHQERQSSAPFFCWMHLYDPHEPYLAHPDIFGDKFESRPYDGELAYVDQQIGRLFDALEKQGLAQQTVIVVVGDHGESLGEHGEQEHGYLLHDSTLHVPMIIADPRRKSAGTRVSTPVSLVDLFPTLLELGGLNSPGFCRGRSLQPALEGKSIPARFCYSQSEEPYLHAFWSPLQGVTKERWRYVRSTKPELYDLIADPAERDNLAEREPAVVRKLDGELTAFEAKFQKQAGMTVTLSSQEQRALESLGYTGGSGSGSAASRPKSLPDIKDMLGYLNRYNDANHLIHQNDWEPAATILEPLVREVPTYLRALLNLGQCRLQQKRYDEAASWFQSAIEIDPNSELAYEMLGFAYLRLLKLDLAEQEFRRLLELQPESERGHLYLGEVYQRRDNFPQAMRHYAETLRINPQNRQAFEVYEALRQAGFHP